MHGIETSGAMKPATLPPNEWQFPAVNDADEHGVVGVGADLSPQTLIAAYAHGMFPMPIEEHGPIAWWSPDPRGVLPLDGLVVTRSMRRSLRRFRVTIDTSFSDVIRTCASLEREGNWIDDQMVEAYIELHRLGWAHSVETWLDDELVGGLYGVKVAAMFAGESMFHIETDASKVALIALVHALRSVDAQLLDVQWPTDHLATLGVTPIARTEYLHRVGRAVQQDCPPIATKHLDSLFDQISEST